MQAKKTITSDGLQWTVCSGNERGLTYAGRNFFASRCKSNTPWSIREHDQCIITHGHAKPLRVWANRYETKELSEVIRCIVGESQGYHPSKTFYDHMASFEGR